ncbi:MAG: hypothetical protein R3B57_12440 [Phycisphaerales bacterium]
MRQLIAAGITAICVLAASPATAATAATAVDLTDAQKQQLSNAQHYLKQLESNLKLAEDSAGPGTDAPTGSKLRLTEMRLEQARVYVEPTAKSLDGLPTDDADVEPVVASFNDAKARIAALDDRLAGKTAAPREADKPKQDPKPAPAPNAKPATETVRLDYKQEEQLKNARFNLREVEGNARALEAQVKELEGVEDKDAYDYRKLVAAMSTIENAKRKAGWAADALKPLPANGEGVAEQNQHLAELNASIAKSEAYLTPIHERLQQIINPANYPDLHDDLERLRGLSVMYGNPMILQTDRPQAGEVFKQGDATMQEVTRIAQKYRRLIEQQTEDGKRIEGVGNAVLQKFNAFNAAAEQQRQMLPDLIRSDMGQARELADQAVAEQKPLFFTGGIPQQVGEAEEELALYETLDPANAPAIRKELEAFKADLKKKQKALEEQIIRENTLPPDRYAGADKKALTERASNKWKQIQKDAKVLTVRFPSEQWKRETMWRYSNGTWYFIDRSRLQAQVIVKHDKKLAVIRPINLWINHASNDELTATPLDELNDELIPQRFLLLEKVK